MAQRKGPYDLPDGMSFNELHATVMELLPILFHIRHRRAEIGRQDIVDYTIVNRCIELARETRRIKGKGSKDQAKGVSKGVWLSLQEQLESFMREEGREDYKGKGKATGKGGASTSDGKGKDAGKDTGKSSASTSDGKGKDAGKDTGTGCASTFDGKGKNAGKDMATSIASTSDGKGKSAGKDTGTSSASSSDEAPPKARPFRPYSNPKPWPDHSYSECGD